MNDSEADLKIQALKELWETKCCLCQRLRDERFGSAEVALELQAKITGETITQMRRELDELKTFKANMQGRYTVIAVVVSAAISVGILLLNYALGL